MCLDHHGFHLECLNLNIEHQAIPGSKQGACRTGKDVAILGHPFRVTSGWQNKYQVWELQAWKRYKYLAGLSVFMCWLYVS